MSAISRKDRGLPGKLLLSTALLITTAAYGYWQKKPPVPQEIALAAAPAETLPAVQSSGGVLPYEFHDEGPVATAITMPKGRHVEDGEYTSGEWESGFGTVKVKARIKDGAFTGLDYLLVPDERQRSQEISHFAKPLLVHEVIHDQKAKVNIITTATYTSWAFQDAMADVIQQATRPRLTPHELETLQAGAHNLEPLYMGSQ